MKNRNIGATAFGVVLAAFLWSCDSEETGFNKKSLGEDEEPDYLSETQQADSEGVSPDSANGSSSSPVEDPDSLARSNPDGSSIPEEGIGTESATPTDERLSNGDPSSLKLYRFKAGEVATTKVFLDPEYTSLRERLILRQSASSKMIIQQTIRPTQELFFTQGSGSSTVTETFTGQESSAMDILITVDADSSMNEVQLELYNQFHQFVEGFARQDWRLAVNTTTSSCLRRTRSGKSYITSWNYQADPYRAKNHFKELIYTGRQKSCYKEQGIRMATAGLLGWCGNRCTKWRRKGAKPISLIVSRKKNCGSSQYQGCAGASYETGSYLTQRVAHAAVYGMFALGRAHGLCAKFGNPSANNPFPHNYVDLVGKSGGVFHSLCSREYSLAMQDFSTHMARFTGNSFQLSHPPLDSSRIKLRVDGRLIESGYTINNRTVQVDSNQLSSLSSLEVEYSPESGTTQSRYTLPESPDPRTIIIRVNNQALETSQYTYDSTNRTIELLSIPPPQSTIAISYRPNIPLSTRFQFESEALIETLTVKVDHQTVQNYSIDENSSQVVFTTPPEDGSLIEISYQLASGPIKETFTTSIDTSLIEAVSAVDGVTGDIIDIYWEGDQITIEQSDPEFSGVVDIVYDLAQNGEDLRYSIPLKPTALPDSVKIYAGNLASDVCQPLEVSADNLLILECESADFATLEIRYSYIENYRTSFIIPNDQPEQLTIGEVTINDQTIGQFEFDRENSKLSLEEANLPPAAEITVAVY